MKNKKKKSSNVNSQENLGRNSEKMSEDLNNMKDLKNVVNKLEDITEKLAATTFGDSYEQFGKYIASLLRGLPLRKVQSLKIKILNDVLEMRLLQETSPLLRSTSVGTPSVKKSTDPSRTIIDKHLPDPMTKHDEMPLDNILPAQNNYVAPFIRLALPQNDAQKLAPKVQLIPVHSNATLLLRPLMVTNMTSGTNSSASCEKPFHNDPNDLNKLIRVVPSQDGNQNIPSHDFHHSISNQKFSIYPQEDSLPAKRPRWTEPPSASNFTHISSSDCLPNPSDARASSPVTTCDVSTTNYESPVERSAETIDFEEGTELNEIKVDNCSPFEAVSCSSPSIEVKEEPPDDVGPMDVDTLAYSPSNDPLSPSASLLICKVCNTQHHTLQLLKEHYTARHPDEEIHDTAFNALDDDLYNSIIQNIGPQENLMDFCNTYNPDDDSRVIVVAYDNTDDKSDQEEVDITTVEDEPQNSMTPIIPKTSSIRCLSKTTIVPSSICDFNLSHSPVAANGYSDYDDVKTILKKSLDGRTVLKTYDEKGFLDDSSRKTLVHVIIDSYLSKSTQISTPTFKKLSEEIEALFPTECKEIYYIPYNPAKCGKYLAKGKLIDRYWNKRRKLTSSGVITRKKQPGLASNNTCSEEDKNKQSQLKQMLKQMLDGSSWEAVELMWENSYELRKSEFENGSFTVEDVLSEWPSLTCPRGHELLHLDFKKVCKTSIVENWDEFEHKLIPIMRARIRDPNGRKLLKQYDSSDSSEVKITLVLLLLGYLCRPPTIVMKRKKSWKPSAIQSQEGFICHVKTAGDIELKINEKRSLHLEVDKYNIQPFLLIVGPNIAKIHSCYVILSDKHKYKANSVLDAVDMCFKTFFNFNLQYQIESEQIWLIIQQCLYKIVTPNDRSILSVSILMSDLKVSKVTKPNVNCQS